MLLPVLCVCVCVRQEWVVQGIGNRWRGKLRSTCVFIWGCGVFPKSPGILDSCAPILAGGMGGKETTWK